MSWDDGTPYVDELADGLYAYVQPDGGWMVNNCGVVIDGSGDVVLVDTASTERRTRALLAQVSSLSPNPPRAAVNTHHHPDHTFGNGFLPATTTVIGHELCRDEIVAAGLEATKMITAPDYGDLRLRPPVVTFSERMTLHLQGFGVELRHMGRAHTSNDIAVWLPDQRVVFAGDLAFSGGQPFFLEGSVTGFQKALHGLRALDADVLVPGHGPVVRGAQVQHLLDDLEGYVDHVAHVAEVASAEGLTPLEAAQKFRHHAYERWAEPERFVGNLHRAFSERAGTAGERITVGSVWPDMVAFNGGPIGCLA